MPYKNKAFKVFKISFEALRINKNHKIFSKAYIYYITEFKIINLILKAFLLMQIIKSHLNNIKLKFKSQKSKFKVKNQNLKEEQRDVLF